MRKKKIRKKEKRKEKSFEVDITPEEKKRPEE